MFRGWTRWIVRSLISILLISSMTVFITWRMFEIYMHRILERTVLATEIRDVSMPELLTYIMTGKTEIRSPYDSERSPIERITQQSDPSPLLGDGSEPQGEITDESIEAEVDGREEIDGSHHGDEEIRDAVPVFGSSGWSSAEAGSELSLKGQSDVSEGSELDALVMSADEFVALQDRLSDDDKAKIFTIVFTKVPQHEFQSLSYMLEEGLTSQELEEIYDVLSKYLTEEEVQQLSNIIQSYE